MAAISITTRRGIRHRRGGGRERLGVERNRGQEHDGKEEGTFHGNIRIRVARLRCASLFASGAKSANIHATWMTVSPL